MKNKNKCIFCSLLIVLCAGTSCLGSGKSGVSVALVETTDTLSYNLSNDVSTYNHTFQVFTDKDGSEYVTFLNRSTSEIFIYGIADSSPLKVIKYETEGPNGVGTVYSHYMRSWNEFLLPGMGKRIFFLDSCAVLKRTINFSKEDDITGFMSYASNPFVIHDNMLYSWLATRRNSESLSLQKSPSEIAINLSDEKYTFSPTLESAEILDYLNGRVESKSEVSNRFKCFDGKSLVYSYAYMEDLVVMSLDFKTIRHKKARSKYIGELKIPNFPENLDFDQSCALHCTNPYYGRIVYDPYRKLYYRFAYPKTELESQHESWYDLTQSGRNEFSIIVLDEDLNVIGETMFPRDRFRSNLYFVCKDGFYISCNHYKNPGFTDDKLQFVKFELKREK